ncbi:MAG: YciE/YciF ferroxidase family protein [Solirubrobacteraceae bacterium]
MFEHLNNTQELFKHELGAALTMEREITGMLEDLIDQAREQAVRQALSMHLEETRGHVANVERAFHTMEWDVDDAPCPVVDALRKGGKAKLKMSDESLADSVIVQGAIETEHHEMAVYEGLIQHARVMQRDEVVRLLEANYVQERETLKAAEKLAEQVAVKQPAGATAG